MQIGLKRQRALRPSGKHEFGLTPTLCNTIHSALRFRVEFHDQKVHGHSRRRLLQSIHHAAASKALCFSSSRSIRAPTTLNAPPDPTPLTSPPANSAAMSESAASDSAGGTFEFNGGVSRSLERSPRRGDEAEVINSVPTGIFTDASRRAKSGDQHGGKRMPSYLLSQSPRGYHRHRPQTPHDQLALCTVSANDRLLEPAQAPACTNFLAFQSTNLHAQYSNAPLPLPIRVSFPLTQTGTSGNTRIHASAPLTGLILRLMETSADVNWEAVSLAEARRRRP